MEIVEKLEVQRIKHYTTRFGMFKCSFCDSVVKRRMSNGKRDKSCGCMSLAIQNNGLAKHNKRIHETWTNMKTRCLNPKYEKAHRYSERGITLYKEWNDFKIFLKWALENGYEEPLQIDRRNNNNGYCPENCHFVTSKENARNRECNKVDIKIARKIREMKKSGINNSEIGRILGIGRKTVSLINLNQQWIE